MDAPMAEAVDVATQLAGLSSQEFLDLVRTSNESVVVIETAGRDGSPLSIGSGFVVSDDGLIATNLHVIGEARPIKVRTFDGQEFKVTEIFGTDKKQDVALIRIEADSLTPLQLGEPENIRQGQPIFALGNPQGLSHSVVTGVVSGFREHDDGMSLIQLAIPIEQGNSGGPLLDMQGRVHGLLTLKSLVTDNLGYAVRATAIRDILSSPNPIPMSRWLTIGTLHSKLWEPRGDVNWKQRAGVIKVDGVGRGFGGRALCLSRLTPPDLPFELAVDVKLEEEDGAAGLVFHSDGEDVHYGFYPSSGALRLSRFDGPTVYRWNVLHNLRTPHYRPGEWNRLKVRITSDELQCYCNDELIITHADPILQSGRVGIVKFRHTTAEFKRFVFADMLPSETPSEEQRTRIAELADRLNPITPAGEEVLEEFADLNGVGQRAMREHARILEQKAERLRQLALEIHERQIRQNIVTALRPQNGEPELLQACLLVSALDNPELDTEVYHTLFDDMVDDLQEMIDKEMSATQKLEQLHEFFFNRQGFHGSHSNYYHASNSYINEVIDDREGLPLTLSILYVSLARNIGLEAHGIGLPGHFIARVKVDDSQDRYVDVFEGGEQLSVAQCRQRVREYSGLPWRSSYLNPQPADEIVMRMLRNLIRVSNNQDNAEAALRYVRTILALDPDSIEDQLYRAVLCLNTNRFEEALQQVDAVLEFEPPNIDLRRVRELRETILEKQAATY